MAKVHKSYRIEADIADRVAAWAAEHGTSITQAVEDLLTCAMDEESARDTEDTATTATASGEDVRELLRQIDTLTAQAETWQEQKAMLGEHILDLRSTVSNLTAQVAEKDRQIERLHDITEHSQMLEAAQVAGVLQPAAQDGTQGEAQPGTQPRGVWAWLARKIGR